MTAQRARALSLSLGALCLLALLSLGGLLARQRFLTRGLPRELPGPNPHAAVSPYGINVAMLDWADAERDTALDRIAAAGFRWLKQPVYWGHEAGFDRLLAAAVERGLRVVPLLDGDPAANYAPPADPAEFAAWAGSFAARFGDQLTYYQIWDEPNLGIHWGGLEVNPAGYAALLAAAHDAITAADPDAVIVAAALAPTVETGPANLSDVDYLTALYELGADAYFEVAGGKPYGFDTGPADRRVERDTFNLSRLILLREVMERFGDDGSALWAGNFGWNALPAGWAGQPSIWGQTDPATQAEFTRAAFQRAIDEWPWAGVLFLESYAPAAGRLDDPRWGFALVNADLSPRSSLLAGRFVDPIPNFQQTDPAVQAYTGGWHFGPAGADISQSGDRVQLEFEGTDFGVRVRRGDYRAYFYVTVDGEPANALPQDDLGAYLNLTSPDRTAHDVVTVPVARHLAPGRHTAELVAERGWDQWALVGLSAANLPDQRLSLGLVALLGSLALASAAGAIWSGQRAGWGRWVASLRRAHERLGRIGQLALTAAVGVIFALSGWLAWLGGPFRRLGDGPQTLLLAAAAGLFCISPWLLLNVASGLALFLLVLWRLDLGLALIAVSAPFYVYPKPVLGYRFSPVEMFVLIAVAAWALHQVWQARSRAQDGALPVSLRTAVRLSSLDRSIGFFALIATLSLLFTRRLDVATNEWRMVVIEPVLFYLLLRTSQLDKRAIWRVVDAFVLSGLLVALLGLVWYAAGSHVITAEGGLPRLRSIYGSPNNVGLYLGRVIPLLLAVALTGRGWRRRLYGLALLPVLAAVALSFSKGAILLGLPVGMGLVLTWVAVRRWGGRRAGMTLAVLVILALLGLLIASRVPALAGRLSLDSATTDFRVSLWKASAEMIRDHPWTGVGLDNFLYAYRGRYLRPEAWQEPDLSHPHNLVLDFWARLGILGLAALVWMQAAFWRPAVRLARRGDGWFPLALGLLGLMAATLAHGLVDQSYFLIDLAFAWMLTAGLAAPLAGRQG